MVRRNMVARVCGWLMVAATPFAVFAGGVETKPLPATTERLDRIIDEAVDRYHLPGIAVGVIQDGKVVYNGTRGETIVGSGKSISSDTVFKIASNSKAMTASVLARLVDAGKLRWEDPVIRYLPDFRMYDPWVTREMQVKDLLVHNSGLPQGGGDLMLWPEPNHFTRKDIIAGLAHIKPAYSFRSGYAYDNLLYVVAGEVAAAAAGQSYETLVRKEVFEPLSLDRCRVGAWQSRDDDDDIAQPHALSGGRNVLVKPDAGQVPELVSAAAGGIRCSLSDMMVWARNWLDPDEKGKAWLSAEQRRQAWTPRTPMPISARRREWDGTRFYAYGYGWRIADVDGAMTVSHTGTLSGMYSVMTLLPDQKSGFVVLINGEAEDARTVLTEVLLKVLTRPDRNEGVPYYAAQLDHDTRTRVDATKPPVGKRTKVTARSLKASLGRYRDPWFGEVRLCEAQGGVRFESQKSPMLTGQIVRSAGRYLIDWDHDSVDLEAWMDLEQDTASGTYRMRLAKVDPEGDFSFDYEDLAFERVGGCG